MRKRTLGSGIPTAGITNVLHSHIDMFIDVMLHI